MALDPRISLMGQPVQIPMPDFGRTMLQATQLQEAMQRQRAHEITMQDLLRQRQEEKALQEYVARQMGRGQAGPLSQLVPDTSTGTPLSQLGSSAAPIRQTPLGAMDPAWPYESFTRDDMEATRTPMGGAVRQVETQRPVPGVQAQTVTEVAPGRQQQATTVTRTQGPQRLTENLDWQKMYALSPSKGMALFKNLRDMERGEATDEMKLLTGSVNALDDLARIVNSQESLDKARSAMTRIPGVGADIAATLPEVYDPATWPEYLKQLVPLKQRLQQEAASKNITWGLDENQQYVPMQATEGGDLRPSRLPKNVRVLPPTQRMDLGTSYGFSGPGGTIVPPQAAGGPPGAAPSAAGPGGTPLGPGVTKDIQGKARAEAQGTVQGKAAGETPQKLREAQATLGQLEQKHALVGQDIDRALELVRTSRFPTTGVAGEFLKTFYQPGRDLASLLETIGANIGLDELQTLKGSGTTLGQVTEAEHRLLQSVMGSLRQSQSAEQFTRNLLRLKTSLGEVKQRRQQAAQHQFGGTAVPPPAASPYGHLNPEELSPEQRREELQWLKQRYQGAR